ncbi:MAG: glycosyltransferase family 39 protein [Gammaproteobacteria bacterium]
MSKSLPPVGTGQDGRCPAAVPVIPLWLLLCLCAAFVLPGLIGHDPWKQDETYVFDIIRHVLHTGDWVVPMMAGKPFMEKPPLYYLVAAGCARMFSPWLALPDAARLASGFFTVLTLWFAGLTARELWGRGYGARTVLVLTACLGLPVDAHEMVTDVALLCGFSVAFYGLALTRRRAVLGGLLLGTGVGIGFMSKGLFAPGIVGLVALLLPLVFRPWRSRGYALSLAVAMAAAMPWLVIWPYALYQRSHELFMTWFWMNNLGRYFGFANLGARNTVSAYFLRILVWFAWPAWPLAGWALWRERGAIGRQPALQLGLLAALVMLAVLSLSSVARDLYALPILLPLALLAGRSVDSLPPAVARLSFRVSAVLFGALGLLVWTVWVAMMIRHATPRLPVLSYYLPASFKPHFQPVALAGAVILTVIWLSVLGRWRGTGLAAVCSWMVGVTLVWGLLATLWLPWINDAKSYRSMMASLTRALPAHVSCLAGQGVDESQRAMLDYYDGILVRQANSSASAHCNALLVEARHRWRHVAPGFQWREIWRGSRPGDRGERDFLFGRRNRIVALTGGGGRLNP